MHLVPRPQRSPSSVKHFDGAHLGAPDTEKTLFRKEMKLALQKSQTRERLVREPGAAPGGELNSNHMGSEMIHARAHVKSVYRE